MEREVEKTLLEIECAIKNNERRGNTHTQSVLEQAREIIELCAQAARTPSDLKKILERDTAQAPQTRHLQTLHTTYSLSFFDAFVKSFYRIICKI